MQRKVFRVEHMFVDKHARATGTAPRHMPLNNRALSRPAGRADMHGIPDGGTLLELRKELEAIYAAIDRNKQELASLHANSSEGPRVTRATHALGAAIGGMEKATQQILKAAEGIDENARTLHASLKSEYELGLTQDIQDHVVRIYEACNFQDLSGQHITKAMDTLRFVEQHVARMIEIWGGIGRAAPVSQPVPLPVNQPIGRALASGPKIEGDAGHVSQNDIDALFD